MRRRRRVGDVMGRFRPSSLGSAAVMLAVLLVLLRRYGTALLFLVVGAGLLWYGRLQREAQERAAEAERDGTLRTPGEGLSEPERPDRPSGGDPPSDDPPAA